MSNEDNEIPVIGENMEESEKIPSLGRFLFGSGPRIKIFREIQQGVHYSDLTDKYSDSLVSSTVNDFRDKNIAYKTSQNHVKLTPIGEYLCEDYSGLLSDIKQIVSVNEFFNAVPTSAYDLLDETLIENGEVISGSVVDKNAVIYDYVDLIRSSNEIREIVPTLIRAGMHTPEGKSIYGQQILNGELECTFIHTDAVYNVISDTEEYRQSEAREHQNTNRVTYYKYPDKFPFTLSIYDNDTVTILLDDTDGVKILFKSDTEACLEWANNIFETYKEKSEEFQY